MQVHHLDLVCGVISHIFILNYFSRDVKELILQFSKFQNTLHLVFSGYHGIRLIGFEDPVDLFCTIRHTQDLQPQQLHHTHNHCRLK
jgi:hypothetical protein